MFKISECRHRDQGTLSSLSCMAFITRKSSNIEQICDQIKFVFDNMTKVSERLKLSKKMRDSKMRPNCYKISV